MTGSSSDETAGRVRAFLHGYREDDDSEIIEHINRDVTLTVGDLRALLDEREQLRATITADGEHSWALAMERDATTARAEQAEAANAELLATLTELAPLKAEPGELLTHYGIAHAPYGWAYEYDDIQTCRERLPEGWDVVSRQIRIGEWRPVAAEQQRQGSEEGTT